MRLAELKQAVESLFCAILCAAAGCRPLAAGVPPLQETGLPANVGGTVLPAFHAATGCPLFRAASARTGVLGHDGSRSVLVGSDTSQWFFTDTFFGGWYADGSRAIMGGVHTSTATVGTGDLGTCFAGAVYLGGDPPEEVLVHPPGEDTAKRVGILGDTFFIGTALWTYYALYESIGSGALDIRSLGTGVLQAQGSPARFVRPSPDAFLFSGTDPTFGDVVLSTPEALYVYGGRPVSPGVNDTVLARVSPDRLTDRSAYRFFAGLDMAGQPTWTADESSAAALFRGGANDIAWNPHLQAYLATYIVWLGQEVDARVAPQPWGPWSAPEKIIDCYPKDPRSYCYEARQHPELGAPDGISVVLSYDTNTWTLSDLSDAAETAVYWPRLVRLTFTR